MRIIEAKNILDRVVNESKQVSVENQPGFNNAVFFVSKLDDYIEFLYFITTLSFSEIKKEDIEQQSFVQEKRNMLSQEELNVLNSLVNRANVSLPVVYSVVDSFSEKQDPRLINIKIPIHIKTLEELSNFNSRIEKVFKIFDYGADKDNFSFSGVDKGTGWLEIVINNPNLHIDFTVSLHLALYFLQNWNAFKGTNNYNLNFNIFVKCNEGKGASDYEESFKNEFFDKELKREELRERFQLNGRTESEKIGKIMKGARSIIELMQEGSELRISYNPPEYVQDGKNYFEIDYKKLPKFESK